MRTYFTLKVATTLLAIFAFISVSQATVWTVDAANFTFTPQNITGVMIGDTIHWVWIEGSHTTTSTDIPEGAAMWDEPLNVEFQEYDYVPQFAGTYNYKCTPHASLGMVGSFVVDAPNGVAEAELLPEISISPNPFNNEFTIDVTSGQAFNLKEINVFNVSGQKVFSINDYQNGLSPAVVSLRNEESGIYFVEIIDQRGLVLRQKILKK